MLIELDTLTGDGDEIKFTMENEEVSQISVTRPTELSLMERNTVFSLSTTREATPHRDRSYCSLPEKRNPKIGVHITNHVVSQPFPDLVTVKSKDQQPPPSKTSKVSCCCKWMRSKFKTIKRSSRVENNGSAKDDTISVKSIPRSRSLSSRRRVMMAQPASPLKKENKRSWDDERHENVVYKVMLKKVTKIQSPSHEVPDGLQWETQKVKQIKGATLPYLVGHLCKFFVDDWGERNFLTVFLATYRCFAKPAEVLELIIEEGEKVKMYSIEKKGLMLSSIIGVLKTWMQRYFEEDFYDPPGHPLLEKIFLLAKDYKDEGISIGCQVNSSHETECDFVNYVKSKLSSVKARQLETTTPKSEAESGNEEDKFLNLDSAVTSFLNVFSPHQIAEQLTILDANLFLNVVSYHCLDAARSSKKKPATVKATIDQFNKVVYCVHGTCLCSSLTTSQRAKVFCKWIEIAQKCLELKNFSSLRAIVSGLQAHYIHKLKSTWKFVPHPYVAVLEELGCINTKELIRKVGTAKVNTENVSTNRIRKYTNERQQQTVYTGLMHGAVPYLGSFITDLTYLHTAKKDYIENGLINFSKRRSEFELLAQLQLWQASCRNFQKLKVDQKFSDWFHSVPLPSEEQADRLSEEIEPTTITQSPEKRMMPDESGLEMNGSVSHGTQSQCDKERTVNVHVVRKDDEPTDIKEVKTIELCSNDRSPAFKKKALQLFDLEEKDLHNFSLLQILSDDKELHIPESGNVFYAMNSTTSDYSFVLLEEGAEYSRENCALSPTNKQKQQRRKSAISNLVALSTTSPIKTLYRHLGKSRMSPSHSPATEHKQYEGMLEAPDTGFPLSRNLQLRKKSADYCFSRNGGNFDSSSDESDNSSPKKILKKWRKGKHKRNLSDSEPISADNTFNKTGNRPHSRHLIYAITDTFVLPLTSQELTKMSVANSSVGTYRRSSTSNEISLNPAAVSSTWPRNRIASVPDQQRLSRKTAIRKHHSHPRHCGTSGKVADVRTAFSSDAKRTYSKCMDSVRNAPPERIQLSCSNDSLQYDNDNSSKEESSNLNYASSASITSTCNNNAEHNPIITVQCPSPIRLSDSADVDPHCSSTPSSGSFTPRIRLSSETITTLL